MTEASQAAAARVWRGSRKPFRKPMPRDEARRQSLIVRFAVAQLGGTAEAITFLNQTNAALGGEPLQLATATAEGYSAVERFIINLAAKGLPT